MRSNELLAFTTPTYDYLCDEICNLGGYDRGEVEVRRFPDGERYQRIITDVSGRDVLMLGGTISDADTLEFYDLACALVKYGAESLTLLIPYFGYSTMERAVRPGEVVTAKSRARLLSAIPAAYAGNRVMLLDLHVSSIAHYFEGDISTFHIYGMPLIKEAALDLADGDDFVLACTDAGRAKWVESLANDMGVHASFVFKRRLDGSRTEVLAVSAQVDDRYVLIYDDMIRTGSSLLNAAQAYKDAGARRIAALTTHGLFPGEALQRLRSSGLFEAIVATNSHPRATHLADDFLRIRSVAPLLVDALSSAQGQRTTIAPKVKGEGP
ncbi:MAG: ribose-phosphate pyrophosphokinase [Deltaproteobacteria bacterium]|nr:ribose-phosphate pyrophosphokinase [Deltaproteobacteria bacterium]